MKYKNVDYLFNYTHLSIYKIIIPSVLMLLSPHGYLLTNIKLFLSANVSKYKTLKVSAPKYDILPKPEVSPKMFKLEYWL